MTSHIARVLPWIYACLPAGESRKSKKANSDRLKPSSTKRALASLGVHPCRFAMRFRRLPLSTGRRMLRTIERDGFIETSLCNYCKHCSICGPGTAGTFTLVTLVNRLTMISPERSKELDSIEVNIVGGPGRAIFVPGELIRALTPQQEVLVR